MIDILSKDALDVWIYTDTDWRVRSRHAPHVDREEWTVKFPPTVVASFEDVFDRVVKIVGVSDDHEAMARCVTEVQKTYGQHVSAALSQPYYLDVTRSRGDGALRHRGTADVLVNTSLRPCPSRITWT